MEPQPWTARNLETQGYCLPADERAALRVGLRFATGVCLMLTVGALAAQSATAFLALSAIGAAAGFGRRHPFDHLWNGLVRKAFSAPALPPSPPRRRHAFKVATALMLTITGLLFAGLTTAALVVGGLTVAACTSVTVTNFCIPSEAISLLERRLARRVPEGAAGLAD